jgi:hypothetical protein
MQMLMVASQGNVDMFGYPQVITLIALITLYHLNKFSISD